MRDLRNIKDDLPPRNGIPHHGLLFLCTIIGSGSSAIGFYQTFSVISNGVVPAWFWCAESLILLAILGMIKLMIRIERGYSMLDVCRD